MATIIEVTQHSKPEQIRIKKKTRDERTPDDSEDITGWAISLIVKRSLLDSDALAVFDLAAVLVDALKGVYKFVFTTIQTSLLPGTYPAEIRFWSSGVTTDVPDEREPVEYRVFAAVDNP